MDKDGNLTRFMYDQNSNLKTVTDAKGGLNRKASRTDPLGATEIYGYDGNGNLTGHTDRRGKVTIYQYDGINRRKFASFGYTGSSYEKRSTTNGMEVTTSSRRWTRSREPSCASTPTAGRFREIEARRVSQHVGVSPKANAGRLAACAAHDAHAPAFIGCRAAA
jgi:YD repeat-containing protein